MPPRGSRLERELAKEKAAREQAEAQLAEARRQHPLELAALRADKSRREREFRGQLREGQAARVEAEGQAATLTGELEQAHADHQAELAEVGVQAQATVVDETARFEALTSELERQHAAEVERLAAEPAAKRAAEAEQARKTAELKLAETTRRLKGQLAATQERAETREQDLREQVAGARREHAHAQARAAGLGADLDQAHAQVADLHARLEPRQPEAAVAVCWLRDSPAEGCHVAGRVFKGRGPRFSRQTLAPGVPSAQMTTPGQVQRMPAGAAEVLARAAFVSVLGPTGTPHRRTHGGQLATAEELRGEARWLQAQADELEQAEAEHVEDVSG